MILEDRKQPTIYTLKNIPLDQPDVLSNAVKNVNQSPLLELLSREQTLSHNELISLVKLAAQNDFLKIVSVQVPLKGIHQFVNVETLSSVLYRFVHQVSQTGTPLSSDELIQLISSKDTQSYSYKRRLLYRVQQSPILHTLAIIITRWGLPIAELFCKSPLDYVRLSSYTLFRPSQFKEEIIQLLSLLDESRPQSVLEIGTNRGETLYLFARYSAPDAELVTVDIQLQHPLLLSSFARAKQNIQLIQGNSTAHQTIQRIKEIFPNGIDFLMLDGDHSYEGIRLDFENFGPLVKQDGLIAFHDIVEDNRTRYGINTGGWAGGVPRFWQEIKMRYQHWEFIHHPEQDGLGIGVIKISG